MGIVSGLKGLLGKHSRDTKNEVPSPELGTEKQRCLIKSKLTKKEYKALTMYYYRGATSYRTIFKNVFLRRAKKVKAVMAAARKKASNGCDIDETFVRFYTDITHYIDIPFDVFSEKKDMRISRRNNKRWNKTNILRILKYDPSLRELDDKLLKEAIKSLILEMIAQKDI